MIELATRTQAFDAGYARYLRYVEFADKTSIDGTALEQLIRRFCRGRTTLRVLDVGAGSGTLSRMLHAQCEASGCQCSMVLIEPSSVAVRSIEEQFEGVQCIDIVPMPFEDWLVTADAHESFDIVFASHVSYYFDDLSRFFLATQRLRRPDGIAVHVAASMSLLQNDIYRELLPLHLADPTLPRTFDLDGNFTFAESLELAAFEAHSIARAQRVASHLVFPHEVLAGSLAALEGRNAPENLAFFDAIAFLWRFEPVGLWRHRERWASYLRPVVAAGSELALPYEDCILVYSD